MLEALPRTVEWRDGDLFLLDQTRLPSDVIIERQDSGESVWRAIKMLKVRGAPAIGVAAAYGLCVAMKPHRAAPVEEFRSVVKEQAAYLDSARPTAVNLSWALRRLLRHVQASAANDSGALLQTMIGEAERIHAEDQALCIGIGESGLPLVKEASGILTHCNAGALATSGIGTATAPLYLAKERGTSFRVFADETRPLLQGARLTAWELDRAGVEVTLVTDSMAATLMQGGEIDLVITGTDRVAANGDVANKIGTLSVAILANHFGIPFYVAAPSSTIDLDCPSGTEIPIEERSGDEVTRIGGVPIAPDGVQVRNPAFDVTPSVLVAGLITERGIVRPPYRDNLSALFGAGHSQ